MCGKRAEEGCATRKKERGTERSKYWSRGSKSQEQGPDDSKKLVSLAGGKRVGGEGGGRGARRKIRGAGRRRKWSGGSHEKTIDRRCCFQALVTTTSEPLRVRGMTSRLQYE